MHIRTDFRAWITFGDYLRAGKAWAGIFDKGIPDGDSWHKPAIEFYESRNEVPRAIGRTSRNLLDYTVDGELIVASFQQAYGIDLTSIEHMHWHRFKALLSGLPDDTKLSKVIGYRSYDPADAKRKHEDIMREQRAIWALEAPEEDDGMGGFGDIVSMFGG